MMTTVSIIPTCNDEGEPSFRAVAGKHQSVGKTAGEALDSIAGQLPRRTTGTLVVVQHHLPDQFFTAEQQQRLTELMQRWRKALDADEKITENDQRELDALIEAEVAAATRRSERILEDLGA